MSQKLFFPMIETKRLVLRPLRINHSDRLFEIFSSLDGRLYDGIAPWFGIQDAMSFIKNSHKAMLQKESLLLGVFIKSTDELAGKCLYLNYNKVFDHAEISFTLAHAYERHGLTIEAGKAFIDHGFNALGLDRVIACQDLADPASVNALRTLGFARTRPSGRWELNSIDFRFRTLWQERFGDLSL